MGVRRLGESVAKRYDLILFDCFNTLYVQDASRVPSLMVDGVPKPTTVPAQHARLSGRFPMLDPVAMYHAHRDARRWAEQRRDDKHRELVSQERFNHAAGLLGLPLDDAAVVDELMAAHYETIIGTFHFPEAHRKLLDGLRRTYRLGLFSNFDHAPPLRVQLAQDGLDQWLDPIVVSAELGWRKPADRAFRMALDQAASPPERTLFVGDSFGDDVVGAQGVGMDVAWIKGTADLSSDVRTPGQSIVRATYELNALTDLAEVLAHAEHP